jgi:DNA processing protein
MYEWKQWKIEKITYENYPETLKQIKNCPKQLYFRGKLNKEIFKETIAVVGSRNISKYGNQVIEQVIPDLVSKNITIISGFMYGADSKAHQACMNSGGKTIAVLGGGLDHLYPTENDKLYTDILNNNGLVISEYEPNFKPTLWSFPQRNRIVSGLSNKGILIIEAGIKSGSLITAKIGQEQKKKIFAVPGSINSKNSEGTNYLIKENLAKLVTSADDILGINNLPKDSQKCLFADIENPEEKSICKILSNDELSLDEISRTLKIPVNDLSTTLSFMSLKGIVSEDNGKFYLNTDYR